VHRSASHKARIDGCVPDSSYQTRLVDRFLHDLFAELPALAIKATASPARDDARHLMWLRDRVQDRFAAGIVLHTGPRPFDLDDRIRAAPICALWG